MDTLILGRLLDYPRTGGHSIESYGEEFGLSKIKFNNFKEYTDDLLEYCVRDVHICHKVYNKYVTDIHLPSLLLEQKFQLVCNMLHTNGFYFNKTKAEKIHTDVCNTLATLDADILSAFRPKSKLIREVHPRETKHGTLNRGDFRFVGDGDLSVYNGGPFSRFTWEPFNPASHKQVIDVLVDAKWKPVEKTKTHEDVERTINSFKRKKDLDNELQELYDKLESLLRYGWSISETNLNTLPLDAPAPARLLAKRIQYESRRRTLHEWLEAVEEDGRIHAEFVNPGAWTLRMAHRRPNAANIPNEFFENGTKKLLGKELRSLWGAPKGRLLAGVDAEGIQLRIFAHYINDPEFTNALVNGRKADKTDPHSLNQRIIGPTCKSRQAAKRFIYALLLGGGLTRFADIMDCTREEAQEALDKILERYTGLAYMRREIFPHDADRGWFEGLDGRKVRIPGDDKRSREHYAMSGYLQCGEAIIMKMATLKWVDKLKDYDALLVNLVHDEWQVETPNNMETAITIAKMLADSLREVGEELGLRCPLAGSYWNDDHHDYTIGVNWYQTH